MAILNIIVLNYNNYEETKECLASLRSVTHKDVSIFVIDNASIDDSTVRLEKEFPEFSYFYNSINKGYAGGMNFGLKQAIADPECKYVFCLTNDTVLENSSFDDFFKLVGKSEYHSYGSFQVKMLWYYDKKILESAGLIYSKNSLGFSRGGFTPADNFNAVEEILGCCGGACIYKREAIEELILKDSEFFDQDFYGYYEDMDVALRLQWRGWKSLYVTSIIVSHKLSKTFKKDPAQKTYLSQRNNIYVLLKDLPLRFILKNMIYIIPVQFFSVLAKAIQHKENRLVAARGKFDGFKKYAKMRAKAKIIQTDITNWKHIEKFIINKWKRNKPTYL